MDTIVALATPAGTSALAVIRVSGSQIRSLVTRFFRKELRPRQMERAFFFLENGKIVDDVLACFFPGPKSYTGEDLLEIFPHGNMVIVREIMRAFQSVPGVRPAEAGEFTRRAFELGKLDLVQAEAVGQLIHSTNLTALENAQRLLKGEFSEKIAVLIHELTWISAKLELDVDFAEEEADPDYTSWLVDLEKLSGRLEEMYGAWMRHQKLQGTPQLALAGKPNAGKSSLINALVKEDRVLVSSQAGTTRDWVEVPLFLERGEVMLVDTAGFGAAVDELDELSQARSKKRMAKADALVWIEDGTQPQESCPTQTAFVVRTRADSPDFRSVEGAIEVDCLSGTGIEKLKKKLSELLLEPESENAEAWMVTERQAAGINLAKSALDRCVDGLRLGSVPVEILAFEVRAARDAVREITGDIDADHVLGAIFSSFCIGK